MNEWYGEEKLFESLAWSGLKKTEAWTEIYNDADNKRKYDETIAYINYIIIKRKDNNP